MKSVLVAHYTLNSENEANNKILEKQKRSLQISQMSILFTREICISSPLYEFKKTLAFIINLIYIALNFMILFYKGVV